MLECFSQSRNLQTHKRLVHSTSRPYDCRYCGKLLKTHIELKQHVRIHSYAKMYSCRHCSAEGFKHYCQLKVHLLKSHSEGAWFTCDICQKKFSRRGAHKIHARRHEAVKPYVCSECPKRFYTAAELRLHHPVHSEHKLFSCGSCDRLCNSRSAVVRSVCRILVRGVNAPLQPGVHLRL